MDNQVLEVTKPVKIADNISGYIALFTFIASVVLNTGILFSNQYISYKRLTDTLIILTAVQLVSAMVYSGIIVLTELKGQATAGRYLQWFITVPLLLVAIIFYTDYLNNDTGIRASPISLWKVIIIVLVGLAMVIMSCLGEFIPSMKVSMLLISLFLYLITMALYAAMFVTSKSAGFFWVVAISFALYGVVHLFEAQYREFCFNILDILTRVGFSSLVAFTLLGKEGL